MKYYVTFPVETKSNTFAITSDQLKQFSLHSKYKCQINKFLDKENMYLIYFYLKIQSKYLPIQHFYICFLIYIISIHKYVYKIT